MVAEFRVRSIPITQYTELTVFFKNQVIYLPVVV